MNKPNIVELEKGTHYLCMCGKSFNPPFCDASHEARNVTKDDLAEDIFPHKLELDEPKKVALCQCTHSADKPFCDGSHLKLEG